MRWPTQERTCITKQLILLYTEAVNMLDGLADEEVDQYSAKNPRIVPVFEIDVVEAVILYITAKDDHIMELDHEVVRELR
mgnify:CR=1 FL=1